MTDRYGYPMRNNHHNNGNNNHNSNGIYRNYAKRTTSSLTATTKAAVKKVGIHIGHYTSHVGGRSSPKQAHSPGDRRGWRRAVPWKHPDEPPPHHPSIVSGGSSHSGNPKLLPSLRGKIPKFKGGFHLVGYGGSSGSGGGSGPSHPGHHHPHHQPHHPSQRGVADTRKGDSGWRRGSKAHSSAITQPLIPEYIPRSHTAQVTPPNSNNNNRQTAAAVSKRGGKVQTYMSHPTHHSLTLSLSSEQSIKMSDPKSSMMKSEPKVKVNPDQYWRVQTAMKSSTKIEEKEIVNAVAISAADRMIKPIPLVRDRSFSGSSMSINLSATENSYSSSSSVLDLDDSAMTHEYFPKNGPSMEEDDDSPDTDKDTSGTQTPTSTVITPVSSLASNSPKDSPLAGCVDAPPQCMCVQRRMTSLCKPRLIIFDWDDTILPTTSLLLGRYQLGLDLNKLSPETQAKMAVLESLAIELLTQCLEYNGCTVDSEHCVLKGMKGYEKYRTQHRLFVVTNAIDSWVEQSSKRYMPRLHEFLLKNNATVASEDDMKRVMQAHQNKKSNVPTEVDLPPYMGVFSADKPVNTPGKANSIRVISASHLFSSKAPHCRNVWKLCTFSEICDTLLLRSAENNDDVDNGDENNETMDEYGISHERSVDLSCSFSSVPCETPRRRSGTSTPSSMLSPRRCESTRSISYSRSGLMTRARSNEDSLSSVTCTTPRSMGSPRIPLAAHSRSVSSSDLSVDFSSDDSSPSALDESNLTGGGFTQFGDLILSEEAEQSHHTPMKNVSSLMSDLCENHHRPYTSLQDLLSRVKKKNKYDWDLISIGDACHESNAALMVGSIINENLSHYRSLCTKVVKLKRHPNMADMIDQMMALKDILPKLFDETDHVFVDDICDQSRQNEQQQMQHQQ